MRVERRAWVLTAVTDQEDLDKVVEDLAPCQGVSIARGPRLRERWTRLVFHSSIRRRIAVPDDAGSTLNSTPDSHSFSGTANLGGSCNGRGRMDTAPVASHADDAPSTHALLPVHLSCWKKAVNF